MGSIRQRLLHEVLHYCPICQESLLGIDESLVVPTNPYAHRECLPVSEYEKKRGNERQFLLFPERIDLNQGGENVATNVEEVRRKIEELRQKQALNPDFGKKVSIGKETMSKEEKEEFKKWRENQKEGP